MNLKFISLLLIATAMFSCKENASTEKVAVPSNSVEEISNATESSVSLDPNAKFPKMEFQNVEHDFGTIKSTDDVETVFVFTNTGEENLLIAEASGSCGCTVPEYPKAPIAPGQKGEIKVKFSPKGKSGLQGKTVTLKTNTLAGTELLTIKANIVN